jgi:DNA-binding CsgD family transcriptional regulator
MPPNWPPCFESQHPLSQIEIEAPLEWTALSLTSREQEVALLISAGKTSKEIARSLSISPSTAAKHRENIYRKLDLHNAPELAFQLRRKS